MTHFPFAPPFLIPGQFTLAEARAGAGSELVEGGELSARLAGMAEGGTLPPGLSGQAARRREESLEGNEGKSESKTRTAVIAAQAVIHFWLLSA